MFVEEYTLVAVADYILSEKPGNTVSNLSSSRALRDVTERHGGKYYASAVGEVNVVAKMKEVGAVVEGYYAAQSAWELAQRKNVDMPITEAAYAVLYEGRDPREALNSLMLRDRTSEAEDAAWAR